MLRHEASVNINVSSLVPRDDNKKKSRSGKRGGFLISNFNSQIYFFYFCKNKDWMPTVLLILGWRFYFFSNENNEPIHIHVSNAEMEWKFWLEENTFEITESFSYHMSPKDKREIRKIIFEHFDYIIEQWKQFQNKK